MARILRRADGPEEKEEIIRRLLTVWQSPAGRNLRLGQLIVNAVGEPMLYNTEDYDLLQAIEDLYDRQ